MVKKRKSIAYTDQVQDILMSVSDFESKLQEDPVTGCWNWTGATHNQGYGMIGAIRIADEKKIMVTAHRAAYRIYVGAITQPNVIHTCSNMACCNPAHLKLGTQKDTVHTMIGAGRQNRQRRPYGPRPAGWVNPLTGRSMPAPRQDWTYKWTPEEILFLRTATVEEIQDRFGYTKQRCYAARHQARKGYRWVVNKDQK